MSRLTILILTSVDACTLVPGIICNACGKFFGAKSFPSLLAFSLQPFRSSIPVPRSIACLCQLPAFDAPLLFVQRTNLRACNEQQLLPIT